MDEEVSKRLEPAMRASASHPTNCPEGAELRHRIACKLWEMRAERMVTMLDVATRVGISWQSISAYERNTRRPPIEVLERILQRGYGVSLAQFFAELGV